MKKYVLTTFLLVSLSVTVLAALALGPAPSWELNQGAANSCTVSSGFSLPGVQINVPGAEASEQGVLSAPGHASLGETHDGAFAGVGTFSFFVFVSTPYSLPANTPLTLAVTTYNSAGYTGGVSYVSTITWDCTTGAVIAAPAANTCTYPLPDGSVVGEAPLGAYVYWAPQADKTSPGVFMNPGTYWVVGVDTTGAYAKIWLTCESQFWVRRDTLQPSVKPPQNGQPLPTRVVS